jgi:predicted Zn-dependent peptidase
VGGGRVLHEAVSSAQPAKDHALSAEELDSALSRLAELRDRGLLTQAEFDAKKRELLGRL